MSAAKIFPRKWNLAIVIESAFLLKQEKKGEFADSVDSDVECSDRTVFFVSNQTIGNTKLGLDGNGIARAPSPEFSMPEKKMTNSGTAWTKNWQPSGGF